MTYGSKHLQKVLSWNVQLPNVPASHATDNVISFVNTLPEVGTSVSFRLLPYRTNKKITYPPQKVNASWQ
jgi:hypothetical protein